MSGVMAGCLGHQGSLLCSLVGLSRCPGWRLDFRGDEPDVRAGRRMFEPCSFGCRSLAAG